VSGHSDPGEKAVRSPEKAAVLRSSKATNCACQFVPILPRNDEIDNGTGELGDALNHAPLVDDCHPPWDSLVSVIEPLKMRPSARLYWVRKGVAPQDCFGVGLSC
jgi:hypothetical protein